MTLDPASEPPSVEHDGVVLHFCSSRCLQIFRADPRAALDATPPEMPTRKEH